MNQKPRSPLFTLIISTLSALIIGVLLGRFLVFGPSGVDFKVSQPKAQTPKALTVFSELVEQMMPSVVNISTRSVYENLQSGKDETLKKFFEFFFQGPKPPPPGFDEETPLPEAMSLGSGFIISKDGLILTDNHVIADAEEVLVSFADSSIEPKPAKIVGSDPELDLALLKIESETKFQPVEFGDSDQLKVGDFVLAIGNPFGQGHSVTHGIISATGRDTPDFPLARYLQTDAPINPGNSGGPIINLKGEVIGIANAIDARAQGIGFAIPINVVKKVLPELKTKGSVARGYIGILVNDLTPEVAKQIGVKKTIQAPFVAHVYPGEPADQAGLKPYDVILSFNGKKIKSSSELIRSVTDIKIGTAVPVEIQRGKKKYSKKLTIQSRPSPSKNETNKTPMKEPVPTGMILDDSNRNDGVIVSEILEGGPAESSGLQAGDLIFEINRKKISNKKDFYKVVKTKKSFLLRVLRQQSSQERFIVVVLNLSTQK